jgi:transposase
VSRQSVSRWASRVADGGQQALKATGVGRPAQLGAEARGELVRLLKQGALAAGFATELWTLPRIRLLIARHLGVDYSEAHLSVCSGLGFGASPGRALQRDEQAIRQ